MRFIFIFSLVLLLAACGNPSGSNHSTADTSSPASSEVHGGAPQTTGVLAGEPVVLAGCYEMTMKRDTAFLSLQVQDTVVSGKLRFHWYARDGNVGTIKGVLRDSLIVADYTFESEGLTSVREVIFKIEGPVLQQAVGELEERDGKIVFRDHAQLQYMRTYPFVKIACPE